MTLQIGCHSALDRLLAGTSACSGHPQRLTSKSCLNNAHRIHSSTGQMAAGRCERLIICSNTTIFSASDGVLMSVDEPESPFGQRRPDYLGRMHEQLEELVADRDQMSQLLQVAIEIGTGLDLHTTLHRIVNAALGMTGARYGAIGVWAPDGTLSSFVHEGIDPATIRRIGHLPVGKGVLGVLRSSEPLRLPDLTEHQEAVGFPAHHPPMRAFLGMPISIRGAVYGALYVADDRGDFAFSSKDEVTARALASAASVAIDNARLFEQARTSAQWTAASRTFFDSRTPGSPFRRPRTACRAWYAVAGMSCSSVAQRNMRRRRSTCALSRPFVPETTPSSFISSTSSGVI